MLADPTKNPADAVEDERKLPPANRRPRLNLYPDVFHFLVSLASLCSYKKRILHGVLLVKTYFGLEFVGFPDERFREREAGRLGKRPR